MTRKGQRGRNPYEVAYENGRLDWRHGAPRTNRYHDRGHSAPYAAAWERGYDVAAALALLGGETPKHAQTRHDAPGQEEGP